MKNGTGRPAGLIPGFQGFSAQFPALGPPAGRAWSRLRAWWERGGGSLASPGMRWPLAASAVLCLTVGSFLTGRGSVRSPVKTVVLTVQAPAGHQPDGDPGNLATGLMYSAVRPSLVASEKPVAAEDSGKVASPPERLATAQRPAGGSRRDDGGDSFGAGCRTTCHGRLKRSCISPNRAIRFCSCPSLGGRPACSPGGSKPARGRAGANASIS